jgi:hypothetical protein
MKALTVQQPWAWAIAHGGKDVENRTWSTSHRGPLAIHAGKSYDRATDGLVAGLAGVAALPTLSTVRGAIVAVAHLAGVHIYGHCQCSPWAAWGQYHWVFADVQPLAEPIPHKGALGLWTVDAALEHEIEQASA